QLNADATLAGHHGGIVERVHKDGPARRLRPQRLTVGVVVVAADLDDPPTHAFDRLNLEGVGTVGHVHRGRGPERLCGVGHTQAVVAGRRRDHTGGTLLGAQLHELVEGTTHLECPRRLDAFDLQVDVTTGLGGEGTGVRERRGRWVGVELGRRPLDGFSCDRMWLGAGLRGRFLQGHLCYACRYDRDVSEDDELLPARERARVRSRDRKTRGPKVIVDNPGLKKLALYIARKRRRRLIVPR